SDAGSQFTSIRYGERLAEIHAVPSIGSVGDSYDNALAEAVNNLYKTELIYGPQQHGPWKTIVDVELATLGWVHWHNTQRLHGYLGDIPPIEFEATYHATQESVSEPISATDTPATRSNRVSAHLSDRDELDTNGRSGPTFTDTTTREAIGIQ
ncbi:MAG: integrase core domain-containing protein, partial [Actinomycetota bacterium]|nr:integrase core domain-containing protein [Actinomycetota bacterium]